MSQNRIKGTLKSYLRWPLLLGLLLIAMNVHIYVINLRAGIIMSIYVLFYLIIASVLYFFKRGAVLRNLVDYSMRFHVTVNKLATELDIPICIFWTQMESVCGITKFPQTVLRQIIKKLPYKRCHSGSHQRISSGGKL